MSPASPALAGGFFGFFTTESPEKPIDVYIYTYISIRDLFHYGLLQDIEYSSPIHH